MKQALGAVRRDGLVSIGGKGWRYLNGRRKARAAVAKFRLASDRVASADDAVDLVFEFRHGSISISPYQFRSEITRLIERVRELEPRAVLQIGTCTGGTLFLLTRFAASDAIVVSVDLPHGPFGGGYSPWMDTLFRSFGRGDQRVRPLLGDSHEDSTVERVLAELERRPVDVLFIDGDHSYEGVRRDFELYAPFVRPGGLVAFHDIVPGPPENVGGVPRFWAELKVSAAECDEIVESWEQGSAGIGVLRNTEGELLALMRERHEVRRR